MNYNTNDWLYVLDTSSIKAISKGILIYMKKTSKVDPLRKL